MKKPHDDKNGSLILLKCVECDFHVRFDKNKPPIPGLVATPRLTGPTTVYLTCDNPVVPHTHGYKITL